MAQSYILVEGVNIYANILDTNQLSVMRGSSFILKDAIDHITNTNQFNSQLDAISTGASSGLYRVISGKTQTLISDIAIELNEHDYYSLLTFIIVSCEADSLLQAKEKLLTKLRIQQMQSISQVPDKLENKNHNVFPDELEGQRVAAKGEKNKRYFKDKQISLSESVRKRFEYGQDKKQDFYFDKKAKGYIESNTSDAEKVQITKVLESLKKREFCENFEKLAEKESYRKLNNKIAVIYMDGNSFSNKQRQFITSQNDQINAQQKFDEYIQSKRAKLIYHILKEMDDGSSTVYQNSITSDGSIRLETLLWGGDEAIFVVPAWLGFDLLQAIFEFTKDWKLTITKDSKEEEISLTHAAGIVFCSAKTPIRNIRSLAQSIADNIKEEKNEKTGVDGRAQNAWGYMVLESIDYPSNNNIHDFNSKLYNDALAETKPKFITSYESWGKFKPIFEKMINERILPKRQLYRLVSTIYQNQKSDESGDTTSVEDTEIITSKQHWDEELKVLKTPQAKAEYRLLELSDDSSKLLEYLKKTSVFFNISIDDYEQRQWLWIYLFELWEYICPMEQQNG